MTRSSILILLVGLLALGGCAGTVAPEAIENSSLPGESVSTKATGPTMSNQPGSSVTTPTPYAGTPNEWAVDVVECLQQAGWAAELTESFPGEYGIALSEDIPSEQNQEWSAALHGCGDEIGSIPLATMSTEQVNTLYNYYLESRRCLIERGYSIGEPPSRETFAATAGSADQWAPWNDVPLAGFTAAEEIALNEVCPQAPPAG